MRAERFVGRLLEDVPARTGLEPTLQSDRSPYAVKMGTPVSGARWSNCSVASRPSMSGMRRSMITRPAGAALRGRPRTLRRTPRRSRGCAPSATREAKGLANDLVVVCDEAGDLVGHSAILRPCRRVPAPPTRQESWRGADVRGERLRGLGAAAVARRTGSRIGPGRRGAGYARDAKSASYRRTSSGQSRASASRKCSRTRAAGERRSPRSSARRRLARHARRSRAAWDRRRDPGGSARSPRRRRCPPRPVDGSLRAGSRVGRFPAPSSARRVRRAWEARGTPPRRLATTPAAGRRCREPRAARA